MTLGNRYREFRRRVPLTDFIDDTNHLGHVDRLLVIDHDNPHVVSMVRGKLVVYAGVGSDGTYVRHEDPVVEWYYNTCRRRRTWEINL